jgi:hypothetical protein
MDLTGDILEVSSVMFRGIEFNRAVLNSGTFGKHYEDETLSRNPVRRRRNRPGSRSNVWVGRSDSQLFGVLCTGLRCTAGCLRARRSGRCGSTASRVSASRGVLRRLRRIQILSLPLLATGTRFIRPRLSWWLERAFVRRLGQRAFRPRSWRMGTLNQRRSKFPIPLTFHTQGPASSPRYANLCEWQCHEQSWRK